MGLSVLNDGCAACHEECLRVLSKMLQVTMLNVDAFNKAARLGYIVVRQDGRLGWTLDNLTLLAYFCGRMWSGDRGRFSRRRGTVLWQMGRRSFPAASLGRAFGIGSLKQSRCRRKNMPLPEHFEIVDSLFDSLV